MLRVAIVILALCAVTVPNVFAECAWILWEKTEEGRGKHRASFFSLKGKAGFEYVANTRCRATIARLLAI